MATNSEILAFMDHFGELAVAECNRRIANGEGFILPSVAMAQSALESDWGQAGIMKKANAFFGVKAGGSWTGKVYSASTWEVVEGEVHNITANFRAYDSPAESMADYYQITCSLSRYANAISYGADSSKWKTAKETVTALHAGGYATDSLYVQKIMNTINGRDLTSYDTLITGAGSSPVPQQSVNITKSTDITLGRGDWDSLKRWTINSFSLPTKNLTIKNSFEPVRTGEHVISGLPDYVDYINIDLNDDAYSGKPLRNGDKIVLYADSSYGINLFTTVDLNSYQDFNNLTDFTLTLYPYIPVNNNSVLAYFVKVE